MLEFENKYRNIKQAIIDARSTSIFNEKQMKIKKITKKKRYK